MTKPTSKAFPFTLSSSFTFIYSISWLFRHVTNGPPLFKSRCRGIRSAESSQTWPDKLCSVLIETVGDLLFHLKQRPLFWLSFAMGEKYGVWTYGAIVSIFGLPYWDKWRFTYQTIKNTIATKETKISRAIKTKIEDESHSMHLIPVVLDLTRHMQVS